MQDLQKISVELLGENNAQQAYLDRANTLRLTLTNYSGGAVLLAASPVNSLAKGFAVVLNLGQLYANPDAQAALQLTPPTGWRAEFVSDDEFPAWVIRPNADQPWPDKASLTVTVANLTPTVPAGLYFTDVELHHLASQPLQAHRPVMGVAAAPALGQSSVAQALGAELRSATVFVTKRADDPYINELSFTIFNRLDTALATADSHPELTLSFVPAATPLGYHALASAEAIDAIEVDCLSGDWVPDKQSGTTVKWRCKPATRRATVLGTGEQGISRFVVRNLVTMCQPGPTVMYVHMTGVPGYADGFLSRLLTKEYAPMEIHAFYANQTEFTAFDSPPFTALLSWEVRHATHVLLSETGLVPSRRLNYPVSLTIDQTYELTALDAATGQLLTQLLHLRVTPPLLQQRPSPGSIVLWSGEISAIPHGWYLCNGSNQTPRLGDYFVLGAGDSVRVGQSALGTHTHTVERPLRTVAEKTGLHEHGANWNDRNLRQTAGPDDAGLPIAAEADDCLSESAAIASSTNDGPTAPTSDTGLLQETHYQELPRKSYFQNGGDLTISGGKHYHADTPWYIGNNTNMFNHEFDAEHTHALNVVCRPVIQPVARAPRPAWLALCYICYRG